MIHMMTGQVAASRDHPTYRTTKCGANVHPPEATAWHTDVTCPACQTAMEPRPTKETA